MTNLPIPVRKQQVFEELIEIERRIEFLETKLEKLRELETTVLFQPASFHPDNPSVKPDNAPI